ncbi:MAG: hypothetical protein MUC83_14380 [Pirellula sp.]|nr:hypothetical protein [Pirellula sp.]
MKLVRVIRKNVDDLATQPRVSCSTCVQSLLRGHDYRGEAIVHISGSSNRSVSAAVCKRRRRRSAIEPKIGPLKRENRLDRCYLGGLSGDRINAILAAASSNLLKLLRAIATALEKMLLCWLFTAIWRSESHRTDAQPA